MSHVLRTSLVLCLALAPASILVAQPPDPIQFGEVTAADFELAAQHPDSNAAAVILVDYGKTSFYSQGRIVFEHHRRVHILSEAAFDQWATVNIPFSAQRQTVRRIRAQTYSLGADGSVVVHPLDRGSIFEENIDGRNRVIRFTLPALEPGVIIEFRYRMTDPSVHSVPDWPFQHSEPTLWSEYRFDAPDQYEYVVATIGQLDYHIREAEPSVTPLGSGYLYRWVMTDVPALREEPFTTALSDYQARLRFQLGRVRRRGAPPVLFLTTWEQVADELMEEIYPPYLRANRSVRRAAAGVVEETSSDREAVVALYDFVRRNIQFTGGLGVMPGKEPHEVLQTRSGNSPEIAFLLIAMLRAQGLEASPVLISTRAHGRVLEVYPLLSQFNDVLVHVEVDGQPWLLDATDPHRPYNVLPPEALNERGWLVAEGGQRWIPVPAATMFAESTVIEGTLEPSGALEGQLSQLHDGYAAVETRHLLATDHDRERFVREVVFHGVDGVEVQEQTLTGVDRGDGQVNVDAAFTMPFFAQSAGDLVFFNPIVVGRTDSNPFRVQERAYPVDFTFPRSHSYELRLVLPDGYVLLEAPPNVLLRHPGGGATYRRVVGGEDGTLVVQAQLLISRVIFQPAEYADLREFYAQMIAAEDEQIVLTRATTAQPPGAPLPAVEPGN